MDNYHDEGPVTISTIKDGLYNLMLAASKENGSLEEMTVFIIATLRAADMLSLPENAEVEKIQAEFDELTEVIRVKNEELLKFKRQVANLKNQRDSLAETVAKRESKIEAMETITKDQLSAYKQQVEELKSSNKGDNSFQKATIQELIEELADKVYSQGIKLDTILETVKQTVVTVSIDSSGSKKEAAEALGTSTATIYNVLKGIQNPN